MKEICLLWYLIHCYTAMCLVKRFTFLYIEKFIEMQNESLRVNELIQNK